MSATTLATAGARALEARDYPLAITHYTAALSQSPSPIWYLARSRAYISLPDFPAALSDAESAYHAALSRSNRSLMAESQYRRAVALLRLGQHASADCAAQWAAQLHGSGLASAPDRETSNVDEEGNYTVTKDSVVEEMQKTLSVLSNQEKMSSNPARNKLVSISTFRTQCLGALEKLPKDHPGWKPTVTKVPPKAGENVKETATTKTATGPKLVKAAVNQTAAKDLRTDFYQSADKATISVFIKGANEVNVSVKFVPDEDQATSSEIHISGLPVNGSDNGSIKLVLGGSISIAESTFRVAPVKIELNLKKSPARKWSSALISTPQPLDSASASVSSTAAVSATSTSAPATSTPVAPAAGPSYPTSSKKGPVNWDTVTEDVDDNDGQDINQFFKTLYAGATEEQRRAMQKSFLESNGTALSTDWSDVGNRTVETQAPDGVDVKPWKA